MVTVASATTGQIEITSQPMDATISQLKDATFSVEVTGSALDGAANINLHHGCIKERFDHATVPLDGLHLHFTAAPFNREREEVGKKFQVFQACGRQDTFFGIAEVQSTPVLVGGA